MPSSTSVSSSGIAWSMSMWIASGSPVKRFRCTGMRNLESIASLYAAAAGAARFILNLDEKMYEQYKKMRELMQVKLTIFGVFHRDPDSMHHAGSARREFRLPCIRRDVMHGRPNCRVSRDI